MDERDARLTLLGQYIKLSSDASDVVIQRLTSALTSTRAVDRTHHAFPPEEPHQESGGTSAG